MTDESQDINDGGDTAVFAAAKAKALETGKYVNVETGELYDEQPTPPSNGWIFYCSPEGHFVMVEPLLSRHLWPNGQ
jgi:hypothetical protein